MAFRFLIEKCIRNTPQLNMTVARTLLLSSALSAAPLFVQAATIVIDNGTGTSNTSGFCSTCGLISDGPGLVVFDDFTLSEDATLNKISWDAVFATQVSTTNFQIGIWTGINSDLIMQFNFSGNDLSSIVTNQVNFGTNTFSTIAYDFTDTDLVAGTYYISLMGDNMYFPSAIQGGGIVPEANDIPAYLVTMSSGDIRQMDFELPYRLTATVSEVPVPAAVWLFSLGLIGLIGIARRKKV